MLFELSDSIPLAPFSKGEEQRFQIPQNSNYNKLQIMTL